MNSLTKKSIRITENKIQEKIFFSNQLTLGLYLSNACEGEIDIEWLVIEPKLGEETTIILRSERLPMDMTEFPERVFEVVGESFGKIIILEQESNFNDEIEGWRLKAIFE